MKENYFIVCSNGKNYSIWEFEFKILVKGKELLGHLDGSSKALTNPKEMDSWECKDGCIISWLFGSIEPSRWMIFDMEMWVYL